MDTTTPKLNNLAPITGRMVNEEDEVHNVVDPYGSLKVIDRAHSSVHDGVSWTFTGAGQILAGQSFYFMGITGDITAHLWEFFVKTDSAPVTVEFYEGATTSNNGTQQTPLNRNRQGTFTPSMQVFAGPTVTNDGTQLILAKILGTQQTVFSDNLEGEWLLKKNTKYTFKITNNSQQAANIAAGFNWVEVD